MNQNRFERIKFRLRLKTRLLKIGLNQVEIVFGIINRRAVHRGNFESLEALRVRILDFIDYFNRTFARPFNWTYNGRPVKAQPTPRPRTWREKWVSCRQSRKGTPLAACQL